MTILLTPFMSCTAKLPIYAFFTAAFFPDHGALVMIGLYLFGIIMGIIMAMLMKQTALRGRRFRSSWSFLTTECPERKT